MEKKLNIVATLFVSFSSKDKLTLNMHLAFIAIFIDKFAGNSK